MDQVRNELKHYGVLGMKWGKRKGTPPKPRKIGRVGRTVVKGVSKQHKVMGNIQSKRAKMYRDHAQDLKSSKKEMLSLTTSKGEILFTKKELNKAISDLDKKAGTLEKKAQRHKNFSNQLVSELAEIKVRDLK